MRAEQPRRLDRHPLAVVAQFEKGRAACKIAVGKQRSFALIRMTILYLPWHKGSRYLKRTALVTTFGTMAVVLFSAPSGAIARISGQGTKSNAPPASPKTNPVPARAVNPCVGGFISRLELASIEGNLFSVKNGDKIETLTTDRKTVFYRHGKQVASLAAFKDLVGKGVKYYQGDCDAGKDAAGHAYAFKVEDSDFTAKMGDGESGLKLAQDGNRDFVPPGSAGTAAVDNQDSQGHQKVTISAEAAAALLVRRHRLSTLP